MKSINEKWVIYVLVFLGIMILCTYGYFRADWPQPPQLFVAPTSCGFGDITPESIEKEFELKNTGGTLPQI